MVNKSKDRRDYNLLKLNTFETNQIIAATNITGTVGTDQGGTGQNISGRGDTVNKYGKQVVVQGADHIIDVRALISDDLPALDAVKLSGFVKKTNGGLEQDLSGTGGDVNTGGGKQVFVQGADRVISTRAIIPADLPISITTPLQPGNSKFVSPAFSGLTTPYFSHNTRRNYRFSFW